MNVDEAMARLKWQAGTPEVNEWQFELQPAIEAITTELGRLRAELAVEREAVESLGSSFDKVRAELAAAKAASAVTDEESQNAFDKWLKYECWECHRSICEATWKAGIKWMKERGEG